MNEPALRAKIDALPPTHREKVVAAIARVAQEWDAEGRVSEEATSEISKNGWWLPEVLPVLPPALKKRVEGLIEGRGRCQSAPQDEQPATDFAAWASCLCPRSASESPYSWS